MELQPMTLGETLRMLRARSRMTREELAEASGVAPSSVSRYELDEAPNPGMLVVRRMLRVLCEKTEVDFNVAWNAAGDLVEQAADREAAMDDRSPSYAGAI